MTTYSAIPNGDIDPDSPGTTSLFTALRDNPIALSEGASGAPRIARGAIAPGVGHLWFYDYGDESDGEIIHSSNTTIDPWMYQCTDFEIEAGVVVGLNASGFVIILATGAITINGTLDVNGDGANGGAVEGQNGSSGSYGGSGGGGDTGISAGGNGGSTQNTTGGSGGTTGGNGESQSASTIRLLRTLSVFSGDNLTGGAGGGSGGTGGAEDGGHGGGVIVLCAPTITVGAAGVITADGTVVDSDGGGGGGGAILIATPALGYTNDGSVAALGGTPSNAGNGGDGWVEEITI